MSNNSSTGGRSHPRRSSFIPPLPRPPSSIAPAFLSMPSLIAPTRLHIAAPRLMAPRQQSVLQGPAVTSSASSQQSTNQLGNLRKLLQMGAFSDIEVGQYSDFKVKVSTKTFNLHRATVCPQSPFFRAALRPDGFMESKTAEVNLPEDDPTIFALFVQLMYLGELTEECSDAIDYAKLYMTADKYGGPDKINLAFELARPAISTVLSNMCTTWNANSHISGPVQPTSDVKKNWEIFTACIAYVFSNIPSSSDKLKAALVKDAAKKWRRLAVSPDEVKLFLNTVPEFAVEVLCTAPMLFSIPAAEVVDEEESPHDFTITPR